LLLFSRPGIKRSHGLLLMTLVVVY